MTAEHPTPGMPGAVRQLLKQLQWREDMGDCFLVPDAAGRRVLVVPELRVGGPLARSHAYAQSTIAAAMEADYLEFPGPSRPVAFGWRRDGDGHEGQQIRLTPTGWRALGHEDGRNPMLKARGLQS